MRDDIEGDLLAELDWFTPAQARRKIIEGQLPFIDELERKLDEFNDRSTEPFFPG